VREIIVPLDNRSYSIFVGAGILDQLGSLVEQVVSTSNYFFVIDQAIEQTHAAEAMNTFARANSISIEAKESNKTIETVQQIWSSMLESDCDRTSLCLAVGGGIVGDVAGFAAATYMRGLPLVQVPTTLLAMVDASIGGKTGVNLPIKRGTSETVLGKNLAGSFWQPSLVVADVDVLRTLDDREFRCGLAECVKHAMLGHEPLLQWLEQQGEAIFNRDANTLIELVSRCAEIKAGIVAGDEREGSSGIRALLNLGHTFAHAIEPLPELGLLHGEAVSIGLIAALSCAEAAGMVSAERVDQIRCVLTTLGLPTRLPLPVQIEELLNLMRLDKKREDDVIRLVLPTHESATIVTNIGEGAIGLAWASVGASA